MPIQINLLAEEHAAEELRRKDPVKKAGFAAGGVAGVFVIWAILAIVRVMSAGSELSALEEQHAALAEQETAVNDKIKEIDTIDSKIGALQDLSVERVIWADALDALQHCVVDGIHFTRITTKQEYALKEEVRPRRGEGKYEPAEATEHIMVTIYATDTNDSYSKFIETVANHPFFKGKLGEKGTVKLVERTAPQSNIENPDVMFRNIVIRCVFPDTVRK